MQRILLGLTLVIGLSLMMASVSLGAGVFGATDLMVTPTPQALNPGAFGFAADFREGGYSYLNADLGLAQDFEVGAAAAIYPWETDLSLRGKYRILRENGDTPSLAVGIEDVSNGDISPYVVLGKTFSEAGIQGYIGAGGGHFNGLFGGLSKNFHLKQSSLKKLQLFLEADSRGLNVGTRLGIGSQIDINFGLLNMEDWMLGVTAALK